MARQVTRREFALGAGLLALTAASDAWPGVSGDVPWWYDGTIFGVVRGENLPPLFKFEGMELYWVRHLPDGVFELTGSTVTFFRDLASGDWLTEFRNPHSNAVNPVPPAVQGGGPGRGFNYSVQSIRFTKLLDKLPPGLSPPRWQPQTMFASQRDFLDSRLPSIPVVFGSTVHMPWLKWVDMGEQPGHLVWHAGGAKLDSIAELPADYRRRAERAFPALLSADPARAAERALPGH